MERKDQMALLGGVGLGAGLMYLLDPVGGGGRRALVRNKSVNGVKAGGQALGRTCRHMSNRTLGLAAKAGSRLRRDDASDSVLEARVRSKMGRAVSHASAITVDVHEGQVVLSGQVLAAELDGLLSAVKAVRGVQSVENRLEVHDSAETSPSLQGNGHRLAGLLKPRRAALGLGTVAGLAALGVLARSLAEDNDFTRPLRESRWGRESAPRWPTATSPSA